MRIMFVGKFHKMYDEEYIARSFEMLGHEVHRVPQTNSSDSIALEILDYKPDLLLFTKWNYPSVVKDAIKQGRFWGLKTAAWLFDLYIGYEREFRIKTSPYFKANYVFTTDGGHDWSKYGINHICVRQGIYKDECKLLPIENPQGLVFIGSENPFYTERSEMMVKLTKDYQDFKWYGKLDTNYVRGMALNELYASTKIVVGDSVYSPHYWSNRVVETLGRGGFLIHRDVPGLKEEYPNLVTYDGTYEDLKKKIDYYLEHEEERQEIVKKNFEWVRDNYTMEKKCKELINYVKS